MNNMSLYEYLYMIKNYSEDDLEFTDLCLVNGFPLPEELKNDIFDYFYLKFKKGEKNA